MRDGVVWSFETQKFIVELTFEPCDMPLESTFDDSVDDLDQLRADIECGKFLYFDALVTVSIKTDEGTPSHWTEEHHPIAHDSLGACCYKPGEFETGHRDADSDNRNTLAMKARNTVICHYFPDMVRQAVREARHIVGTYKAMNVRVA